MITYSIIVSIVHSYEYWRTRPDISEGKNAAIVTSQRATRNIHHDSHAGSYCWEKTKRSQRWVDLWLLLETHPPIITADVQTRSEKLREENFCRGVGGHLAPFLQINGVCQKQNQQEWVPLLDDPRAIEKKPTFKILYGSTRPPLPKTIRLQ